MLDHHSFCFVVFQLKVYHKAKEDRQRKEHEENVKRLSELRKLAAEQAHHDRERYGVYSRSTTVSVLADISALQYLYWLISVHCSICTG